MNSEYGDLNKNFDKLLEKKTEEIKLILNNKNKRVTSKDVTKIPYEANKVLAKQKKHEEDRKLKSKSYKNKLNDDLFNIINSGNNK
jgi:hypothetical protein|tara:strand:+ start:9248 stop:9505 length:258 start_codon:yes stop_codon:yes gene_type:complete